MINKLIPAKLIILLLTVAAVSQAQQQEAFQFNESGLTLDFEFFGEHLRQRWMLPEQVNADTKLEPVGSTSEVETALHITGRALKNRKRIGGTPGTELRFTGVSESRTDKGSIKIIEQWDSISGLKVVSYYEFYIFYCIYFS